MSRQRFLIGLGAGALLLGIALLAGGYNVSAARGHLPLVGAVLHWTMQNSVAVRAREQPPADLDTGHWAAAGAGHYDLICRDCHGAPGVPLTALARSLEPPPPHIRDAVGKWRTDELFWIVKHGIKMTAMPAWPSQHRDDEVWAMVAFLRRLPTLQPDRYRQLVQGAVAESDSLPVRNAFDLELRRCARCHGYDGRADGAARVPRLAGLSRTYLTQALEAFADGRRHSGIMQAHASTVERGHFERLAQHYADAADAVDAARVTEAVGATVPSAADTADADHGRRIALAGAPERGVPACAACHGPAPYDRASAYPSLAGQPEAYLQTQLRLFRDGRRGGAEFAAIMAAAAQQLTEQDLVAVARYYAESTGTTQ